MDMKWKIIFPAVFILASAVLIAVLNGNGSAGGTDAKGNDAGGKTAVPNLETDSRKIPERDWKVLDPEVSAEAAIIQSLDDNFPFFKYGSFKSWPIASLTKLLTAVVVVENIGVDKKIAITGEIMATEGEAGDLRNGEVYSSGDLLKIMLMMSSNRAAAAIESYFGREQFVKIMAEKARKIGMTQTAVYDASGLNDSNESTASDMLILLKYILERDPEILNHTRLPNLLVQPVNSERSHTVANIDPLSLRADFLGGKTGTSPAARQNLIAILSLNGRRVAVVLLGSRDRFKETDELLAWIQKAYKF